MVITRLVSGLGNQLFQYAIGRQLSIKHGVPLKLDTGFFDTQTLRSFKLENFNINAVEASTEEINKFLYWQKNTGLAGKVFRKVQRTLPRRMRLYFNEADLWVYDPELFNVSPKVYLDGYWQHYRYFENIDPAIFSELTLKSNSPGAQVFERNIRENQSSVSLHVRRGDYVTDSDTRSVFGTLPLEYYSGAIGVINSKFRDAHYYIFSDDLNWAKDNLKVQGAVTFVELEETPDKDCQELTLMSKCGHNIIANSSFSWWGAFLNRNPAKLVIAPSIWVVRPELNSRIQLQFPSWIKI